LEETQPPDQWVMTTRLADYVAWGRKNSLWPMPMGLGLLRHRADGDGPRRAYDVARFGAEALRFSPRRPTS